MSKLVVIALVVLGCMGFGLFAGGSYVIGIKNDEFKLAGAVMAQQKYCMTVLDRNRKTAQQKAGIAEAGSEKFKEIYMGIMDGRYKVGSGQVFQMIKESNPVFSMELYTDLSRAVEAMRNEYMAEQKKLIDMNREHHNLLGVFPGSLVLSFFGAKEIDITIVTSTDVENIYKTGKEDNVDLFPKK